MKRFAKIILGALAALVILLLVALVGINLYLQSGDVQQRIRLATEQALGMPVTVKRTLYTPWGGLTLSGLSLPDPSIPDAKLIEAPQFSVKFRFWPLLVHRFIISQISLASPHLVLRQTPKKQWVLVPPRLPSTKPSAVPPVPGEAAAPETKPAIKAPVFTVELQSFYISDGAIDFIDNKGAYLGRITGLNVDGTVEPGNKVTGDVWIDDIDVAGQLHPNRLRAHFEQNDGLLSVTDMKCALADGKLRAEFNVVTPHNGSPAFQLRIDAEKISIPTLIAESHGDEAGTSGTLRGHLELRGDPLDASTLVGGGQVALDGAQIRPMDFIQQIGLFLRIEELQMLKLREAGMRFEIRDEKFWMTDLNLKTENIIISAEGPIKFNGKMNLDGRFQVSEKLGLLINNQFTPSPEPGYKEVAFTVTGRTSRPETDLLDKITGYHIGNLGGIGRMLKGFLTAPSQTPTPAPVDPPDKAAANN